MSLSLIFALVFLVSWSVGRPASDLEEMDSTDPEWMDSELSRVKLAILTELGLHVSPEQAEHLDMLPKVRESQTHFYFREPAFSSHRTSRPQPLQNHFIQFTLLNERDSIVGAQFRLRRVARQSLLITFINVSPRECDGKKLK